MFRQEFRTNIELRINQTVVSICRLLIFLGLFRFSGIANFIDRGGCFGCNLVQHIRYRGQHGIDRILTMCHGIQ